MILDMPTSSVSARQQRGRPVRLCLMSYTPLSQLAVTLLHEYAGKAEISILDETFGMALELAIERERQGLVDAFVSAGGNAAMLRGAVKSPVAAISIDGFDMMMALIEARKYARRVGVVTYGRTLPELDMMKAILSIDIEQRTYRSYAEATLAACDLKSLGVTVVIGPSVVAESAERQGLRGILAYSPRGVRRGIENGIELARVARLESTRYSLISGVLGSLQEAVLAVDDAGNLIAMNPPMDALLNSGGVSVLGRSLVDVAPELSRAATQQGTDRGGRVLHFVGRDWVVRRAPISDEQGIAGATLTLYDAHTIQEADISLRTERKGRGLPSAKHSFVELEEASPSLGQVIAAARRYAKVDLTVLISGESGTGKELFAQAIHNASTRVDKPFIALNCAAFPETLLESELFGYEDGAFTGARRGGKRGLFEAAHTGTLLLDEIGDMPLPLQSRLLRVLQEREVVRLGGVTPIPIDVRILASTHQSLRELVDGRRFREDLFYRLNILQLTLPPLRERVGDILPLARRFVARCLTRLSCAHDAGRLLVPIETRLVDYKWRGNVRELENICQRLAMFFSQYRLPEDVAYSSLALDCPELFFSDESHAVPMAQQIRDALAASNGNREQAARCLGISRATLWRRMQEVSHETFKNDS